MHLIALKPESRFAALAGLLCVASAGLGWGYATYLSPHGLCVGELEPELTDREFALIPQRAGAAADQLCNRAEDQSFRARRLAAGRHS